MKATQWIAVLLLAFAASTVQAEDWPARPITIVVPFDTGGSVDRLARGLAQFMAKPLGQPITVVDRPGAGGQIGTTWFLQQPPDGYTLMVTPATPYLPVNILVTHAHYTLKDFAFVNAQWSDYNVLAVPKASPYKTLGDLIRAIKSKPGKLSAAVTFGSVGHITTLVLLDALKLPPSAVRLVTFDGGGATRTALAGAQVDFSIEEGQGSVTVKDLIRPLAVFLDHRTAQFDAPPINQALAPFHISVPLISGSVRTLATSAGFRKAHPTQFAKLVDVYQSVLETPAFQAWLVKNQMGDDWLGPDKTTKLVQTNFDVLETYKGLLAK